MTDNSKSSLPNRNLKEYVENLEAKQIELQKEIQNLQRENLELENSYLKYFYLYQLVPVSYIMVNEAGAIREANLAAVKLIGFDIGVIKKKEFIDLVHPSDKISFSNFQVQYYRDHLQNECEIRLLTFDCTEIWVNLKTLPSGNALGDTLHCFVLNDITDRKKSDLNRVIVESEKEALINSTTDLMWSITKDFKLITCNNAFLKSAKNFNGIDFKPGDDVLLRNHYTKEMIDYWEGLYIRGLMGESVKDAFYSPAHGKNPDSWFEMNINPIYLGGEITSLACFGLDITKRKQDEMKLLQSFKMASLGEMAGGIAHEINNPLSILLGFTSKVDRMLRMPSYDLPVVLEDMKKIKDTTVRIASIVKGLGTFSRNADNDPVLSVSIKAVITETLGLCQEKFKNHGVDIIVGEIPDMQFEGRATQISQVILNLLNNAYDAIQNLPKKWILIEVKKIDDLRFQVFLIDSGLGIPKPIAEKMMQPFFTTKEVGKGTGLGLSISLGIMEMHKGKLFIDSSLPNTTFVLDLPIKQS